MLLLSLLWMRKLRPGNGHCPRFQLESGTSGIKVCSLPPGSRPCAFQWYIFVLLSISWPAMRFPRIQRQIISIHPAQSRRQHMLVYKQEESSPWPSEAVLGLTLEPWWPKLNRNNFIEHPNQTRPLCVPDGPRYKQNHSTIMSEKNMDIVQATKKHQPFPILVNKRDCCFLLMTAFTLLNYWTLPLLDKIKIPGHRITSTFRQHPIQSKALLPSSLLQII